jgi:hypothetical protein
MKCVHCDSDWLEMPGPVPEDGPWRSFFYTAYLCRKCGRRFLKRDSFRLIGFGIAGALALGVLIGVALSGHRASPYDGRALQTVAEQGDVKAQLRLGLAYMDGIGVDQNPTLAIDWIRKAADQGYADAQYELGAILESGKGAPQNFPLAFEWYERAAQQNHAEAQYRLAMMYRRGEGVSTDKSKAYFWLILAAAQKHEDAGQARDNLQSSLTREQVLSAQRAAQEWRPTNAMVMTSARSPADH